MTFSQEHEVTFSTDVTVNLVKHSASDSDVAFAARVSTIGERSLPNDGDDKGREALIGFLMVGRHGSPFEHSVFTFYVKAPIFVWREHMRHRIASYSEESGRYKELSPEFYIPEGGRKLVQTGKAGAYVFEEGSREQYVYTITSLKKTCELAYANYKQLLAEEVAKEVARMVLPVNIYSSGYVTMNARSLMNFLSLRVISEGSHFPSYPQREIEMVAEKYEEIFKELMPETYAAFIKNGRVAP